MIEIILHEDIAQEYLDKRSKLTTKEDKQDLANEYCIKIVKEYRDGPN